MRYISSYIVCMHVAVRVLHVTTQMRSRPVCDTPVCTPPRSLDDMDGRGWEVREWIANGWVSVGGAGRSGDGLQMVSRVSL